MRRFKPQVQNLTLLQALRLLTKRQRQVLYYLYYKKIGGHLVVAKELKLTKARIHQLEREAFVKIEKMTGLDTLFTLLDKTQTQFITELTQALHTAIADVPR